MTADLLREAAALMRSRAEAATPGPWAALPHMRSPTTLTVRAQIPGHPDDDRYLALRVTSQADGDHIASWHPAVALAVAKALDDVAHAWEIADGWATDLDGDSCPFEDAVDGGWLAVARAYLGRQS